MTSSSSDLATKVEQRRAALKLTQDDLAELADVSVRFIRSLEHGKSSVRLDKVLDVLDVLGLDVDVRVRTTR